MVKTVPDRLIIYEIWRQRWVDWGWICLYVPVAAVILATVADVFEPPLWFWAVLVGPYMFVCLMVSYVLLRRRVRRDKVIEAREIAALPENRYRIYDVARTVH